jgi:hypothetical protein
VTPRSVSVARKNQDIGQPVALVPDWGWLSAPGTFKCSGLVGRSTPQHPISPPPICLTSANKLRNVTQHKSGLFGLGGKLPSPKNHSEPPSPSLVARHNTNPLGPVVPISLPCCLSLSFKHRLTSNRPQPMPSQPISIGRRPVVGFRPQTPGSCIVGSHQASPHHRCFDASNRPGGLDSHVAGPEWSPLYSHRFRPEDAALERVLDSQVH